MDITKEGINPSGNISPEAQIASINSTEEYASATVKPIGEKQIEELMIILSKYRSGKKSIDDRIVNSEQWWKLRNEQQEALDGHDKAGFKSRSAWLHSVIKNKHADAMDAFPEPNILPREPGDKAEAEKLSKIVPCVLEKNKFENVYSANMWSKNKFGTGVYKVIWDKDKLNGLGDIAITKCNILNLFWEPGIEDIQLSKYFFEVDFQDEDELKEAFPQLVGKQIDKAAIVSKFKYDDNVDTSDKVPVINCYYHKRGVLHYILFVPGVVLYATENETDVPTVQVEDPQTGMTYLQPTGEKPMSERGIYDHGKYPYVFDTLFPVEGSPCGYGYVDLNKADQTEIDLMKTAMVENTMVGAKPRFYVREGTGINPKQFLDLNNPIVNVTGGLNDDYIRPINYNPLPGNYITMLDQTITQLRETSGNTEASTGTAGSGVTAASAIAALQEASGKGSRDAAFSSYRAYSEVVDLCIEMIRQFYDMPRQFRITGMMGEEAFITFDNSGIKPQQQFGPLGDDMGYRLPVFDIKIVPQKRSAYTKMANNELALQFFGLGFFNPQMADQAIACLTMMDFDSKTEMIRMIQQNGTLLDRFRTLLQYTMALAQKYNDADVMLQVQALMQQGQMGAAAEMGMQPMHFVQQPNSIRADSDTTRTANARNNSRTAAMPGERSVMD